MALTPLAGLVGGGIDMARPYVVKSRLQHACVRAPSRAARLKWPRDRRPVQRPSSRYCQIRAFIEPIERFAGQLKRAAGERWQCYHRQLQSEPVANR
ncbi:TadE/TadG family type IV pilus assembly protein [Sphingomonas mali]|uniref:TadE/TadG family type IV pilus assembly protein n=1 Tax=Sphingomonas mali TaxID=40682 RepID=UPI0034E2B84F